MEQQPGQDPDDDGPQPGPGAPGPDGAAPSGSPGPGSGADSGTGGDDDGESVFGPWDALEGALGAAREREELLSGFAAGGVWDEHPPGPELAAALAKAVGPDWRCGSATGEERVGLLRAMAALQSWAGAGLLGVARALIRDDDEPYLGRPRHGDLPDGWDDCLVAEIALALAVSVPSADRTMRAAWELGARLPGVELLLKDGTLDVARARLITEVFAELSDEDCGRAEELLLPELRVPPRKTYTQVERIATAIAAAVDPGLAERRRKSAEKHRSRVAVFREGSGAAGLSGRDLPVGETLAAYAHLDARARQYKDCGAFPGERLDRLRAAAYLDILNGVCADDRIACGHLGSDAAPATDPEAAPETSVGDDSGDATDGGGSLAGGPGVGGSDCPCDECDGRCAPPTTAASPTTTDPDDDGPDDDGQPARRTGRRPDGGGPGDGRTGRRRPRRSGTGAREAAARPRVPAAPADGARASPAATPDRPRRPRDRRSCGRPAARRRPWPT